MLRKSLFGLLLTGLLATGFTPAQADFATWGVDAQFNAGQFQEAASGYGLIGGKARSAAIKPESVYYFMNLDGARKTYIDRSVTQANLAVRCFTRAAESFVRAGRPEQGAAYASLALASLSSEKALTPCKWSGKPGAPEWVTITVPDSVASDAVSRLGKLAFPITPVLKLLQVSGKERFELGKQLAAAPPSGPVHDQLLLRYTIVAARESMLVGFCAGMIGYDLDNRQFARSRELAGFLKAWSPIDKGALGGLDLGKKILEKFKVLIAASANAGNPGAATELGQERIPLVSAVSFLESYILNTPGR